MTQLTYQSAENIALAFGMNWNKDPQWHQQWFDHFTGLLYASFKNYEERD